MLLLFNSRVVASSCCNLMAKTAVPYSALLVRIDAVRKGTGTYSGKAGSNGNRHGLSLTVILLDAVVLLQLH